jgi:Uma2 family endonuclease
VEQATIGGCAKIAPMDIALRRSMTVDQYLAWSETQSDLPRTELINGQIVATAPERVEHTEVKLSAAIALRAAIGRCQLACCALPSGPTVRIDDHTAYAPDALVYCGQKLPGDALVVPNPMIIVEVLSPTTSHTDTSAKLIDYFKLTSVHHYLIIDPDAYAITHHSRCADGTVSGRTVASGTLRLDPPGLAIDVSEFFE